MGFLQQKAWRLTNNNQALVVTWLVQMVILAEEIEHGDAVVKSQTSSTNAYVFSKTWMEVVIQTHGTWL